MKSGPEYFFFTKCVFRNVKEHDYFSPLCSTKTKTTKQTARFPLWLFKCIYEESFTLSHHLLLLAIKPILYRTKSQRVPVQRPGDRRGPFSVAFPEGSSWKALTFTCRLHLSILKSCVLSWAVGNISVMYAAEKYVADVHIEHRNVLWLYKCQNASKYFLRLYFFEVCVDSGPMRNHGSCLLSDRTLTNEYL